jgi:Concanavalin A-like lectin/glucanases superfamily
VLRAALLLSLSACGFRSPAAGEPGAVPDAAGDADAALGAPALCKADPSLLVCFSFDVDPLPASLANEGTASVAAQATNVRRTAGRDGGAALFDTTSQLRVPPNDALSGIVAVEAWVRIDADPAGQRAGILDADATASAVSFFYYNSSATIRQIRFEIGQQLFIDRTLELGAWHYLAQVCESNMLAVYLNGTRIGLGTGCTPATATTFGLQIGQNNNGTNPTGSEHFVGAIDGIRMWTTSLSATAICRTAGRTDC